jgi:hypothetical protein
VKLTLPAGPAHARSTAQGPIAGPKPEPVSAAKGSDSPAFVAAVAAPGAPAVRPPRSHRKTPRESDQPLDQERTWGERCLTRAKPDRRGATRSEKTGRNFWAFGQCASIMILLL